MLLKICNGNTVKTAHIRVDSMWFVLFLLSFFQREMFYQLFNLVADSLHRCRKQIVKNEGKKNFLSSTYAGDFLYKMHAADKLIVQSISVFRKLVKSKITKHLRKNILSLSHCTSCLNHPCLQRSNSHKLGLRFISVYSRDI